MIGGAQDTRAPSLRAHTESRESILRAAKKRERLGRL